MAVLRYQFVRGGDFASDVIAWYGDGDFSHVDIVLDDGTLLGARSDHVGDAPPGVHVRTPGYASWEKQVVIDVPCTAVQKAVAIDFARQQIGKAYDKEAILAFVVARDWRAPDSWFCSELGAATAEAAHIWDALYSPKNRVTPVGLAMVASAMPGRTITVIK